MSLGAALVSDLFNEAWGCSLQITKLTPVTWIVAWKPDLEVDAYTRTIRGAGCTLDEAFADLARQL